MFWKKNPLLNDSNSINVTQTHKKITDSIRYIFQYNWLYHRIHLFLFISQSRKHGTQQHPDEIFGAAQMICRQAPASSWTLPFCVSIRTEVRVRRRLHCQWSVIWIIYLKITLNFNYCIFTLCGKKLSTNMSSVNRVTFLTVVCGLSLVLALGKNKYRCAIQSTMCLKKRILKLISSRPKLQSRPIRLLSIGSIPSRAGLLRTILSQSVRHLPTTIEAGCDSSPTQRRPIFPWLLRWTVAVSPVGICVAQLLRPARIGSGAELLYFAHRTASVRSGRYVGRPAARVTPW